MFRNLSAAAAAALALSVLAVPATAQETESYKLLKAVRGGDGAEVEQLLSTPNVALLNAKDRDSGDTALHIVTGQRNLIWLNFLLRKGARTDLQNAEGNTPLAVAAQLGWAEGAERLLDRKAPVDISNRRGETPLILAVHRRDVQMVRLLLGRGADPKKSDRIAGYSALDYAKRDPRAAIILKMLEAPQAPAKPLATPAR
jgi:ankyrin repeat protein